LEQRGKDICEEKLGNEEGKIYARRSWGMKRDICEKHEKSAGCRARTSILRRKKDDQLVENEPRCAYKRGGRVFEVMGEVRDY
jgi:hypothetical protein